MANTEWTAAAPPERTDQPAGEPRAARHHRPSDPRQHGCPHSRPPPTWMAASDRQHTDLGPPPADVTWTTAQPPPPVMVLLVT